ncbi:hypothetical protein Bca101_082561 [Brassica carinata]
MWVVGAVCIFAGASAVDLLVPRSGFDHESDGAWSSDETFYPAVLHYHASLVAQSWVRVRCFLFRCCRPSLEVPVAARIESRDSIRVSLVVSVSRSRALDVAARGNLALGSLASSKVVLLRRRCARYVSLIFLFGGLNGCIRSWDWRVGGSIYSSPSPNDADRLSVDSSSCCRSLPVASRFEPPFSLGARGNWELSPLTLLLWIIIATLLPVHLLGCSSL